MSKLTPFSLSESGLPPQLSYNWERASAKIAFVYCASPWVMNLRNCPARDNAESAVADSAMATYADVK